MYISITIVNVIITQILLNNTNSCTNQISDSDPIADSNPVPNPVSKYYIHSLTQTQTQTLTESLTLTPT